MYLGRPSGGDSPMAIGYRAMRDQSSPQPPQQRNPTPRTMPGFNTMAAPSPYGAVSDEARRRYEERYNKKKAQEAEKAAQEARDQASALQAQQGGGGSGFRGPSPSGGYRGPSPQQQGQGQMGPPAQQWQQQQRPQQPPPPPQQQQPPQQQYRSPPVQQQPPPQQYQQQQQLPPRPPQIQQQQSYQQQVPGGYPQGQGQQQNRLSAQSYQSPTTAHQPHHQPQQQQQQQPQQRWSNQPQSPSLSFSQKAVPPPDQSWNRPTQTPPQAEQPEDHELRTLFGQFDSSRTGQLNSYDLQRLLAKDATMEAREDCVKMLMNIFDTDRSGSINFMEFEGLYRYIKDWHGIFLRFDRDDSGTIDRKELHAALLGFGFSLPPEMVKRLEKRFAPPPQPGLEHQKKGISFDRFLLACVTVKHYTEAFRKADEAHQGRVTLDYNQFMDMVLESPS